MSFADSYKVTFSTLFASLKAAAMPGGRSFAINFVGAITRGNNCNECVDNRSRGLKRLLASF